MNFPVTYERQNMTFMNRSIVWLAICFWFSIGFATTVLAQENANSLQQKFQQNLAKAQQGDSNAQTSVGYAYDSGKGVSKDKTQAVAWYRKAADQGNATAQCNLGICCEYGTGVAKDEAQAVAWYRKAADQGNATAQCNLGICCEYGTGVAKDEAQAVAWYRKAADQGNATAQINLGNCCKYGRGVAKDEAQAVAWYRKAADQGNATAQINLGNCYADGTGVARNFSKQMELYQAAASNGNDDAIQMVDLVYKIAAIESDREQIEWLLNQQKQADDYAMRAAICLIQIQMTGKKIEGFDHTAWVERMVKALNGDELSIDDTISACELFRDIGKRLGSQRCLEIVTKTLPKLLHKTDSETDEASLYRQINLRKTLAEASSELGSVNEAEKHFVKLLELTKQNYGNSSQQVSSSLKKYTVFLRSIGEAEEAIPLLQQKIQVCEANPEDRESLPFLYTELAFSFFDSGQIKQAVKYHEKNLQFHNAEKKQSDQLLIDDDNQVPIHNLANCYRRLGEYGRSQEMWERLIEFRKKKYGSNHNMTHGAMHGLATTLTNIGERDKALELFSRIDLSAKKINDENYIGNPGYAQLLHHLENPAKAETILKEGLARSKPATSIQEPLTKRHLLNFYAITDRAKDAAAFQEKLRKEIQEASSKRLAFLNGDRREKYLTDHVLPDLQKALSLGLKFREDSRVATLSAGWLLNGKSSSYDVLAQAALLSSEELAPKVDELKRIRSQLAMVTIQGADDDASKRKIADLETQQSKLESELANLSLAGRSSDNWKPIGALMSALPFDSRFVTFAKVTEYDFKKSFNSSSNKPAWAKDRYVAWVIPPVGEGSIQCVDLGLAGPIDEAIANVRSTLTKTPSQLSTLGEQKLESDLMTPLDKLSALVLEPLSQHIDDVSELLISPDGELWAVPFEILRQGDKYLIESKRIRYLSSGRELIQKIKPYSAVSPPVVFANPDYDLSTDKIEGTRKQQFALRTVKDMKFPALGFSEAEADAIIPAIEKLAGEKPKQFLASLAQEANFKDLHRPRMLAISTHGYFDNDSKISNPLLRCGLALAGANNRQQALKGGKEDGILTGLEIVGTDLRGTELVVLSACETGLGDITNGEGVAGLRQAFQLAGAQSVVSSLWQVEDGETARLMKLFFANLAAGKSKSEGLRQAQLTRIKARRARHGAAHPFFWAAFTLTGQD